MSTHINLDGAAYFWIYHLKDFIHVFIVLVETN